MVMETEKFQDVQLASWRPRRVCDVVQSAGWLARDPERDVSFESKGRRESVFQTQAGMRD